MKYAKVFFLHEVQEKLENRIELEKSIAVRLLEGFSQKIC